MTPVAAAFVAEAVIASRGNRCGTEPAAALAILGAAALAPGNDSGDLGSPPAGGAWKWLRPR